MFIRTYSICIFFGLIFLVQSVTAQVTTINYSSSGLPTTICNIFNVATPYKIGGLTHYPIAGGVKYNDTDLVLKTQAGTSLATNLGTAYGINYPFKKGKYYNIKITAWRFSKTYNSQNSVSPNM